MNAARIAFRYLAAVFIADVLLQLFLAGAGVFSAGAGTAARESSALDPHRVNGMVVMLLALLILAVALLARNGWRWALLLFVLTLLQPVLAIAGAAGGLHVLNAAAILGTGGVLATTPGEAIAASNLSLHRRPNLWPRIHGRLTSQTHDLLPAMPSYHESVRSGQTGNGSGTGRRALLAAAATGRRPGSTLECRARSAYPRPMARDAGCGLRGG
jgi:hypothetical protein